MPELPEVETVRRQLEPHLLGRTITATWSSPSPKFSDATDSLGYEIQQLDRRGKYLIAELRHTTGQPDRHLILHLGMTGKLRIVSLDNDAVVGGQYLPALNQPSPSISATGEAMSTPADEREPNNIRSRHVHATLQLDNDSMLEFDDVRQFGRLRVVAPFDYITMPTLHELGPDPFEPAFTAQHLRRYVHNHRQAIKTQLLSQRPVAGLGNIYVDEALWIARVHPLSTEITVAQSEVLHQAIRDVLAAAIDHGGTTIRDYVSADGATGQHQFSLVAYGRSGEPCLRCETPMISIVIAGRTSTYCPNCQRRRWRRRT